MGLTPRGVLFVSLCYNFFRQSGVKMTTIIATPQAMYADTRLMERGSVHVHDNQVKTRAITLANGLPLIVGFSGELMLIEGVIQYLTTGRALYEVSIEEKPIGIGLDSKGGRYFLEPPYYDVIPCGLKSDRWLVVGSGYRYVLGIEALGDIEALGNDNFVLTPEKAIRAVSRVDLSTGPVITKHSYKMGDAVIEWLESKVRIWQ